MKGTVNARVEARLRLALIGPTGTRLEVDSVVDTGFTGSLVLPAAIVAALGLERRSGGSATLADGSTCNYDNYAAELEWDAGTRGVIVSAVGREALAGMTLLADHKLSVEVWNGGTFEIVPLTAR